MVVDHRVVDGAVLVGVLLELAGLICTVDLLRKKLGSAGQAVYLIAFSFFGGYLNVWYSDAIGAGGLATILPKYAIWIFGAVVGCLFGALFLGMGDERWEFAGTMVGLTLFRVALALPGMALLFLCLGAFVDCSGMPGWLNWFLYDCSFRGWLRWRGLYLLFLVAFYGFAGVGAWAATMSVRAAHVEEGDSPKRIAQVGAIFLVLGTVLSSATQSLLSLLNVPIK